jgi:hypothetical protein
MMWKETIAFIISYSTSINNCIVTHYRLDVPGIDIGGDKIFQTHPDRHWVIRSFPGEKQLGHSIFIKGRARPLLPLCAMKAQRENSTFTFPQVVKEWTQLKHYRFLQQQKNNYG